jgi:hypothetical protein
MSDPHLNGMAESQSFGNGDGPRDPAAQASSGIGGPAHPAQPMAGARPEVAVGAAFVGGLALALLLRRVRS